MHSLHNLVHDRLVSLAIVLVQHPEALRSRHAHRREKRGVGNGELEPRGEDVDEDNNLM